MACCPRNHALSRDEAFRAQSDAVPAGANDRNEGARHRGPHPRDRQLFQAGQLPRLRRATAELCWLLNRGYVMRSSLKLVGDRHDLTQRQRIAIARAACADSSLAARRAKAVNLLTLAGTQLVIDGFNLIITVETALSGGLVLLCRDECVRDLASVHGSYRSVRETDRALRLTGEVLGRLAPASVTWFLDRPVSNSGRLSSRIEELASARGWPWRVHLVYNPDVAIKKCDGLAVSSDSSIIDGVEQWVNLTAHIVQRYISDTWLIDLRVEAE